VDSVLIGCTPTSRPLPDYARKALGSLLTGCGDPHSLPADHLPTRAARAILGVLVRLGTGQPAEVIEHELAGLVDVAELQSELAACMTDFCMSDSAFKATLASLDRERRSARLKSLALALAAKLDGGEPPESAAQAIADMAEVSRTRVADDVEAIGDNVHELFMSSDATCVPLGLQALSRVKTAVGQMLVIGARPSRGKTAMLGTVALAAAAGGWRVLFLSLEMTAVQIRQRLLAGHGRINLNSILEPRGTELLPAIERLSALPVGIRDAVGGETLNIERLIAIVHGYRRKHPGKLVVMVDYLQLITSRAKFDRRHELVGHVCRELKALALRESVVVVAAAQLSRLAEQRGKEAKPIMSDLSDSSDIEKNADKILFIHRQRGESSTELIMEKDRFGEAFDADVTFNGPLCLFEDDPGTVREDWQ